MTLRTDATRMGTDMAPASLWLLRLTLSVHAALAIGQPVLAGSYLSGNFDVLEAHGNGGVLLLVATLFWSSAALIYVIAARGVNWPLLTLIPPVFIAEGVQIGMGHERNSAVHIPLGVFIVLVAVLLAAWSFTPRARCRRTPSPAAPGVDA